MQLGLLLAVLCYLGGPLVYLAGRRTRRDASFRAAVGIVLAGFASHTLGLGLMIAGALHLPIYTTREACALFAWLVTGSFLISCFKYKIRITSVFILPWVAALMLIGGSLGGREPFPADWRSYWVALHTGLVLTAYTAFLVTFLSSTLYLVQERSLKEKRLRNEGDQLPSLHRLDRLLLGSLGVGMVTMTLGIVTGAIWAEKVWGRYWGWDPKETAALVTWLIYLALFHYRLTAGWRGKRAAILNIIGFISVLFTFLGANYFRGMHAF
jgi:cytochrome c-type biogenesis protein CcsB